MTFSILWILLAATVIVVASMRRSGINQDQDGVQVTQPGKALTAAGIFYSLVLLAGFLYIGWQHSIELMK
jgi:lysylphosphatidylglycerol synthetase-like protein (DUF2156 family)